MPTAVWYIGAGGALVALGLLGVAFCAHPIRKVLALNIMASGVYFLLVAPADRMAGRAPDPVPHALVLTGIVVAVSTTALALALIRRLAAADGRGATGSPGRE